MTLHSTIFDNGDFSYQVTVSPIRSPNDGFALTVTSRWKSASNPQEEQVRFRACLERGGVQVLVALLNRALQDNPDGERT